MKTAKFVARVGMLAAVAIVLQYLASLIGIKIQFLDVFDLSDYPAILGTLAFGPVAGVLVELIKNAAHFFISGTMFIGEIANFLIMGSFVYAIGIVYKFNKTKKGAFVSLLVGVLAFMTAGIVFNMYITLPLYENAGFLPVLTTKENFFTYILPLILPFNLVKGVVLSALTLVTYKRLSPLLHK